MVILAVLTTLLIAFGISTLLTQAGASTEGWLAQATAREARYQVARSAMELGLELIRADDKDGDGPGDVWAYGEITVDWEGHPVTLRIVDEESRFPLRQLLERPGDPGLASALLRFARRSGLPEPQRALDTLLDWADPDPIRRPAGGESGDYGALRVKNAPLDTLAELELLPAWRSGPALPPPRRRAPPRLEAGDREGRSAASPSPSPGPRDRAGPPALTGPGRSEWSDWLSLSSKGQINVNTASPLLLQCLDEQLTEVTVQEIVARREQEPFLSADELRQVPGIDPDLLFRLDRLLGYRSHTFEIQATVQGSPGPVTLRAVFRRGEGPLRALSWEVR